MKGGSTNGYGIRINSGNIELGTQDNHNIVLISAPVPTDEWVHVATSYNNGRIELYINGILSAFNDNVGYSDISNHGDAGGLGATNGSNAFDQVNNNYEGWIDDFFLFDFALSQSDVDALINRVLGEISAQTFAFPNAPNKPTGLVPTNQTTNSISISWTVSNADQVQVYRAASR